MDDTISRQAAIRAYCENQCGKGMIRGECGCDDCGTIFDDIPSAEPEQRWIPCSERLPEDDTLMLVNYIDNRPEAMDIWIGWHEMENVWYINGEAHSKEYGNEVIAWMPLPEPYKGVTT